ncbi:MAG TPA: hypothetical protein V6C88_15855 [Chroococcidiopsis sp.]
MPLNSLRIFAYKLIYGYKIESSKIGFGTQLDCKEVVLTRAKIGRDNLIKCKSLCVLDGVIGNFNQFAGLESVSLEQASIANNNSFSDPMSLVMLGHSSSQSNIGNFNKFFVGARVNKPGATYGAIRLHQGAKITSSHMFDVVCDIVIGRKTVIAGRESQFWTHGSGIYKPITIGEVSYIGSASRFAPGAKIGKNVIVGLGSVVTKEMECDNAMIAGVPAKVIKSNYDFRSREYLEDLEVPESEV